MNFESLCLSHTSSLVQYVAYHSIKFGLNFLLIGCNVLFRSWRYYYFFKTLVIYDPEGFGNKKLDIENVRSDI